MQWGKRGPSSPSIRRREAFRPSSEALEDRRLLTAFDLTTTQTTPLGVEFIGKSSSNTAGYTVTDVGNVTGSGYDSFVISAPGLASTSIGGKPNFAGGGEGAAYLVFGSKAVNINSVSSYLNLVNGTTNGTTATLTGGQRAGDLGELGTLGVATQSGTTTPTAQTNPTVAQPQPAQDSTHVYGFNFDGLTLVTGLDAATGLGRNSALGYSVSPLGDLNNDGYDDFAISAPNDAGGGRVFVVYGGPALATQATTAKTVDLEPTAGVNSTTTPTKVVSLSLPSAATGTDVGYSVAGIGNYFGNTSFTHDLAVGVPNLTVSGVAEAGAVFAISGNYLNTLATGANLDLSTIGTGTNTTGGIEYTGYVPGGQVGYSVSSAGNSDGAFGTNGASIDNLLIGAPGATLGGAAYLVYGLQAYLPNQQIGSTQSLATLGVAPVTTPIQTNPLQGVLFGDTTIGDGFGTAVATAGDFNDDGVDDIIIGAPGYLTSTGYATVIYGVKGTATTTTSTRLNGIFTVSPVTTSTSFKSTSFIGEGINDYAGYSLAATSHIQIGTTTAATEPSVDVLIGAPGLQVAYLVPGTPVGGTTLTGSQQLNTINSTLNGNEFVVSGTSDPSVVDGGFATSVSARNPVVDPYTGSTTVDTDSVPDLFFGAPFSSLTNPTNSLTVTRGLAGAAYVLEGGEIGTTTTNTGTTTSTSSGGSSFAIASALSILTPVVFTGLNAGLASPPISSLEHLNSYQALPVQLAEQQFRVQPGFEARQEVALHPKKGKTSHQFASGTILNVAAIGHSENKYSKVNTLRPAVFSRGKIRLGQTITFTHKVKVIPRSEQTQTFDS